MHSAALEEDHHLTSQVLIGHLVLADREIARGYVEVRGSQVASIGTLADGAPPSANQMIDFGDAYLMPGAIDAQTHARSQKDNEDFIWASRAAAAGGVTTMVDMPYDAGRLICNAERFELKKAEAQAQARIDFALYGTAHPSDGAAYLAEQARAGAIGFKFSTFGTDPERFPRIPPLMMLDCMREAARLGLMVGVHNEDDESIKALIARLRTEGVSDYRAHTLSRPRFTENLAIHQIYELGAESGCRAHVVHCSNGRGMDICQSYRQQGFSSSIETCLHYLSLCEEDDVARLAGRAKVNPPIRGHAEREALWRHIAAGQVDAVSTDHVSWSLDRKDQPNMLDNASGATGLELLLPLTMTGAVQRGIALPHIVQVLTSKVAKLFRIDHCKGALEVGKDADLVVLQRAPYTYRASDSGNNFANWSPYDGRTIDFKVACTMLRGQWVFDGARVLAEPGTGRFVAPPAHEALS